MGWKFFDASGIMRTTVWSSLAAGLSVVFDGGGSVIGTGVKGDVEMPYTATIAGWHMYADVSGSIQVDIWRDTYVNFPPTVADTIIGGGGTKPNISSSDKNLWSNLTNWNTVCGQGTILRFNVDSCTSIKRATLALMLNRN